ncbi:MAG: 50S ribosomal protein L25 [Myxococcota bacterium]
MDTSIEVTPRPVGGKGANRKSRARGIVPAVVYGRTRAPVPVEVDPIKLTELFKATGDRNTILKLKIGAESVNCLVREVQRHPVSRAILHVDFYAVPDDAIEVMVPLRPVGRPKGAVVGGRVQLIRRQLKVACKADNIPAAIDVDVSPMDVGDAYRVSHLTLPEGVTLAASDDFLVVRLAGKRSDVAEEAKPAAAAPEAEKKA